MLEHANTLARAFNDAVSKARNVYDTTRDHTFIKNNQIAHEARESADNLNHNTLLSDPSTTCTSISDIYRHSPIYAGALAYMKSIEAIQICDKETFHGVMR